MTKTIPAALESLLSDLVDYAGLFPPAALDMDAAARAYAAHRCGTHAFMLGRFVVPAGRLAELAASIEALGSEREPWPLSVLTGDDPDGASEAIRRFAAAHGDRGRVEAVEMRATSDAEIERGAHLFPAVDRFVEIAHDRDPSRLMAALARTGGSAKIRTGGVTAEAFPSAAEVARFIVAAERAGIAWKATAGLHHPLCGAYPLTYEPESADGRMLGFLGVFLAAVWVHTGAADEDRLQTLLEEPDAGAFRFDDDGATWRGVHLPRTDIEMTRSSFARAYGSCSFTEPTGDLQLLGLL